jgi:hypothetical protein
MPVRCLKNRKFRTPALIGARQGYLVRALHVVNRYVGYLLPMPGVFRDYPSPVIRNTQDGTEITLMRWAANLCAVAAARLAGMQAERVSQTLRRCDGASADVLTFPRTAKWARQPTLRF